MKIKAELNSRPLVTASEDTLFEMQYRIPHPCEPLNCANSNDLKDLDADENDIVPKDIYLKVGDSVVIPVYNETEFSNFRDYYNDVCDGYTG